MPPSVESAVLRSWFGSLESVERMAPQTTRMPPGTAVSAASMWPVQPLWIGDVAPIFPLLPIAVWSRSPSLCQATCSTPLLVRTRPTWSMLAPPEAVTWRQGAASAADGATSASTSARISLFTCGD